MVTIIAAVQEKDNGIGKNNDVLFHIRKDFVRMKDITMGHPVIMGRPTYESLPLKYRPLPGRTNIIVTRNTGYEVPDGVLIAHSLKEAIEKALAIDSNPFILGGGDIYRQALKAGFVDRLELTIIHGDEEADTYFPDWREFGFTNEIQSIESDETEPIKYFFKTFEKAA